MCIGMYCCGITCSVHGHAYTRWRGCTGCQLRNKFLFLLASESSRLYGVSHSLFSYTLSHLSDCMGDRGVIQYRFSSTQAYPRCATAQLPPEGQHVGRCRVDSAQPRWTHGRQPNRQALMRRSAARIELSATRRRWKMSFLRAADGCCYCREHSCCVRVLGLGNNRRIYWLDPSDCNLARRSVSNKLASS
jgi:hypothetical protein